MAEYEKPLPVSTYTESHKKYYRKYKPLISVRRKKYDREYKKMWYKENRERILEARRKRYAEERIRRLVEREKILMAENRQKELLETRKYLEFLGHNTQISQVSENVTKPDPENPTKSTT